MTIRYFILALLIIMVVLAVALYGSQEARLPTVTVRLDPQPDGSVLLIPYLPVVFLTRVISGSPKKGSTTCLIHEYALECPDVTLHIEKTNFGVSQ